ncbi:MAG: hypothetical protein K0S45_528 [Nitrospira sp.]|jgi:hypothetical protein|nr:hypothetical protein [Nitrospira sp.]
MGRKYDLVDVMAAIGLVATLFGGYLLVTAADGFWQAPSVSTMTATAVSGDRSNGMKYLQPALGQAIVDDLLLDRQAGSVLSASAMELNRALYDYHLTETTLLSPLVLAELRAFGQEADHQARMQFVMGKAIVNQTRRGIASGILSADQYVNDFNANLIRTAETTGQRMHDQFESTRQAMLGRSIVEAIQEEDQTATAIQERIGHAVIQVTQAQERYGEQKAIGQNQLASATVAALRTDALTERLALLESLPSERTERVVMAHHSRLSPDISRGFLMLACVGLIALFVGGLALVSRKGEVETIPVWKMETLLQLHRSAR